MLLRTLPRLLTQEVKIGLAHNRQYTFTSFVGTKLLGPTKCSPNSSNCCWAEFFSFVGRKYWAQQFFYSQQFKTVGVGATFSLLLATLFLFCWPHFFSFVGQSFSNTNSLKLLGVKNCWAQHFLPTNEKKV